jgi:LemA protein
MMPLLISLVVLGLPLIWFLGTYNGFIRVRNHLRESWSNLDTELQRRHDLIPNLVRTVQGYAAHEKDVLEEVTRLRNEALTSPQTADQRGRQETKLVLGMERLLIRAEAYPDLKADAHFLELQKELVRTEDRIQHVRRIHNANVRDFNNRVEMFPSSLVAGMNGFTLEEYFEVKDLKVREAPTFELT